MSSAFLSESVDTSSFSVDFLGNDFVIVFKFKINVRYLQGGSLFLLSIFPFAN